MTRSTRSLLVAVLLVALGTGCGGGDAGSTVGSSGFADGGADGVGQVGVTAACGEAVAGLAGQTGPLTIIGSFPAQVGRDGDGGFVGTVTATATDEAVSGVTSPEADVYVTRSGTVVAEPPPKDLLGVTVELARGAAREFPARGRVRHCLTDEPLSPGRYEVYAVVTVDGVASTGGPWPIDVT